MVTIQKTNIGFSKVININSMKVLNLYFVVIATFFISSCIESEIIYKVEHNENVIILQRVLTNATSDNYIQVYRNDNKIFNIKEHGINIDNIICNDSVVIVMKKNTLNSSIADTLFIINWNQGEEQIIEKGAESK